MFKYIINLKGTQKIIKLYTYIMKKNVNNNNYKKIIPDDKNCQ